MKTKYKTIGKSIIRKDSYLKSKGLSFFCADIQSKDCLVLKVLRSTRHHAKILKIKIDNALKIKGVVRIFTGLDLPGTNLFGLIKKDQPLLALDKVRFIGDAVALVAAKNQDAAKKAVKAIQVIYEDIPAIFDPEHALKKDAPFVHESGNLLTSRKIIKGDVEKAFKDCKVIVENTYKTSRVEHCCLEPDAGFGYFDKDNCFVIYASTQNPHYDQKEIANLLGVEEKQIRIIQASTGGGFGSKLDLNTQGFIGLALYYLKRPVRIVYTREEVFVATSKRHPFIIKIKTGANEFGRLLAIKAKIICDTGAYSSYGIPVVSRAAVHISGPYEIENAEIESLGVYTNNPISGAMRGFGVPQTTFAQESQIDIIAQKLDMDPFEIRQINALRPGSKTITGQVLNHSVGICECLDAVKPFYEQAKKTLPENEKLLFIKKGIGIGSMWYGIGNTGVKNPSTAKTELDINGNINLYTGCAEIGQGSTTVFTQIVSEILGVLPDSVKLVVGDTKQTSSAGATSASRQTYISGNAVKIAAEKLSEIIKNHAAKILNISKNRLVFDSGFLFDSNNRAKKLSFKKIAIQASKENISLCCEGYFNPDTIALDPDTGQGSPYATYAFACHLAFVSVDILTGKVIADKIVAAHDVGKAINPQGVIGQICGGVAMGIGFALMEEFKPEKTKSMKDYHIPGFADMPDIVPVIVESSEPTGPFGAKGVGEPALIPTAPAICNAIDNAIHKRIYNLPASLERVLGALSSDFTYT